MGKEKHLLTRKAVLSIQGIHDDTWMDDEGYNEKGVNHVVHNTKTSGSVHCDPIVAQKEDTPKNVYQLGLKTKISCNVTLNTMSSA